MSTQPHNDGAAVSGGGVRADCHTAGGGLTLTTKQAAMAVSKDLGVDLSLRDIDTVTRGWPLSKLPPLDVKGHRAWGPEHVARLRETVAARQAKAGS